MKNPFKRFECWYPRCPCYAPFGVRLALGELHQDADDVLCCNNCGRPVREKQIGFLEAVWGWIFRGEKT